MTDKNALANMTVDEMIDRINGEISAIRARMWLDLKNGSEYNPKDQTDLLFLEQQKRMIQNMIQANLRGKK